MMPDRCQVSLHSDGMRGLPLHPPARSDSRYSVSFGVGRVERFPTGSQAPSVQRKQSPQSTLDPLTHYLLREERIVLLQVAE